MTFSTFVVLALSVVLHSTLVHGEFDGSLQTL